MSWLDQQRDLRVDCIRGIALLVLMIDHLPNNPVREWMPVSLGLADMAEVFVLLSGYVLGLSFKRHSLGIRRRVHFVRRAAILYVSYALTAVLSVWLVRTLRIGSFAALLPSHLIANSWEQTLHDIILLDGRVTHLCILLLYTWFAVGVCLLPRPLLQDARSLIFASAGLYLTSQIAEGLTLPEAVQETTYYNPFAWQFLLFSGVVAAQASDETRRRLWSNNRLLAGAFIVQGGLLLMMAGDWSIPLNLVEKRQLGFARYLHVMSAAVIFATFLPKNWSPRLKLVTMPLFLCSRNSLWVYCGGSLLVVLLSDAMLQAESVGVVGLLNVAVIVGCLAFAVLLTLFQRSWLAKQSGRLKFKFPKQCRIEESPIREQTDGS